MSGEFCPSVLGTGSGSRLRSHTGVPRVYPESRSAGPSASHSGSTRRVNGEGPMMAAWEAISERNYPASRQAIKNVTRGQYVLRVIQRS
jgi:hypothetical protein